MHYRERAAHCRQLAEAAGDEVATRRLIALAEDLEEEAGRLDQETDPPRPDPD